jgi:hypothetical protein
MPPRILLSLLAATLLALAVAAPASAGSVAYIDDHNLWFSSPDGARKVQVTRGGNNDASWMFPSQGRDGKTVVVHNDAFDNGASHREVLYLYGPTGKLVTAYVMPRYAGTASAVYPIGLDMDWNSNAVAYGYQYCGWACGSLYKGFWLTFSDNQGAFPSDPQGQSDAFNPTFYKTRVVFRDSGGNIFVQPDVAEAPFTSSYQGWITHGDGYFLSRAEVSPANDQVAIDWIRDDGATGITVAQHSGTVPSDLVTACDIPAAGKASYATFSPDGSQMAWTDDEGLKVAGVPNLAAGKPGAKPKAIRVRLSGKATRAAFAKGLTLKVGALKAGRIDASAAIAKKAARKLRLSGGASAARIATRGFAAASMVTVARGHAKAKRAGTVKIRLKPTKAAKRAAKRMRKAVLTIKVSQPGAVGKATVRLK